jgi:hypothetical protein
MGPFWFIFTFVMVLHRNIQLAGWTEFENTGAGE